MHGGVKKEDLKSENLKALEAGMANLARHVENVQKFGLVPVVSINRLLRRYAGRDRSRAHACAKLGVEAFMADHWRWAAKVLRSRARRGEDLRFRAEQAEAALSRRHAALREDPHHCARDLSRKDISADKAVKDQLAAFEALGYGKAPVCIAKTQYSFSTNPDSKGAPTDHTINVREVRLSAGAEFVVAICGEINDHAGIAKYRRRMPSTSARMVRSWACSEGENRLVLRRRRRKRGADVSPISCLRLVLANR